MTGRGPFLGKNFLVYVFHALSCDKMMATYRVICFGLENCNSSQNYVKMGIGFDRVSQIVSILESSNNGPICPI